MLGFRDRGGIPRFQIEPDSRIGSILIHGHIEAGARLCYLIRHLGRYCRRAARWDSHHEADIINPEYGRVSCVCRAIEDQSNSPSKKAAIHRERN